MTDRVAFVWQKSHSIFAFLYYKSKFVQLSKKTTQSASFQKWE